MRRIVVIGSDYFALEVVQYMHESPLGSDVELDRFIGCGEAAAPGLPAPVEALEAHAPDDRSEYVLAVSDPQVRAAVVARLVRPNHLRMPNVVHRDARVRAGQLEGWGNVIGPFCYVGVNARLGSLNTLNTGCSIGHHSRVGDNNFFAPDCHTGNTVRIENDNFFGIGTTIVHGLEIGSGNRVNAGTDLTDPVESGQLVFAPSRTKQMKLYGRNEGG